jgi:TM2 domain-containing membrane protein YozV
MSTADEIMKLKELLDMGAITQEEYDRKKKELLDRPLDMPVDVVVRPNAPATDKSKVAAALLAFFFGAIGAHKFYLGYTKEGLTMLLIAVLTLGVGAAVTGTIAFIEFIIYITKSDEEFERIYVYGHKGWF